MLMLAVAAAALLPAVQDKPLSRADANELRELYLEALADPSGKTLRKLTAEGKKLAGKVRLEDLMEALEEGPRYPSGEPKARGKGKDKEQLETFNNTTVTGYRFEHDGDEFGYAIDLPRRYSPKQPAPLLVDPGHGVASGLDQEGKAGFVPYWRNQLEASDLEDCIVVRTEIIEQIGAGGVRGGRPDDQVCEAFDAFFRDLASRVHFDPDRVYVSGLSQTGYWAWYLGRARADRLAGIAPMGAVTWQVDAYLENLSNLPTYVLHGEADATCPVAQPRATCAEMERLELPVHYREVEGAGHDFKTWQHLPSGLDWLVEQGSRDPYPSHVSKRLQTERTPWCYWIRIEKLRKQGGGTGTAKPTASIEADLLDQDIRITSEGVREIELCLSPRMLDLDRPLTVTWNGKTVHEGPVERDFVRALEIAVDKADWSGTFEAFLELKAPR